MVATKPAPRKQKKKTSTKKPTTAGKTQQPIGGMEDEFDVPPALKKVANKYKKALLEKNKADSHLKSVKETLIDDMKEHKIQRVRVLVEGGGEKILELTNTDGIKVKAAKDDKDDE